MKDTIQRIAQPVHDRQVHSDQEVHAANSQESQLLQFSVLFFLKCFDKWLTKH